MQYFDAELDENESLRQLCSLRIETSIGLDRMFFVTMINALEEEDLSTPEKQTANVVTFTSGIGSY